MIRPSHPPDLVALLDAARSGDPLSLFAIADWLHDADPLNGSASEMAVLKEKPSATIAKAKMPIATDAVSSSCG